jgi:acetolactate synthase-1/2/3 large subunit
VETFAPNARIVQIDIDPTSIHKNIPVSCPIVGDCKETLAMLNKMVEKADSELVCPERTGWLSTINDWKSTTPLRYEQTEDVIKPQYVIERLHELTQKDTIITTEVGQNQMWAAQFFHFDKPNHFITSGGLGVMGFGLPAAIGAKAACPDKTVIDIAGDGSIQMNIQELMTAVESDFPVKIVILNNGCLGMVRQWQELFYDKNYSSTLLENSPDFIKLAEAYGAKGLQCTRPDQVERTLTEGLSFPGTVIMEFQVEEAECVYPMVPAGRAITEMILV